MDLEYNWHTLLQSLHMLITHLLKNTRICIIYLPDLKRKITLLSQLAIGIYQKGNTLFMSYATHVVGRTDLC